MADAGIRGLVGKRMEKKVRFMDADVKITKLSVAEVLEIQEKAKTINEDTEGFAILKTVIRSAVEGADEITDEEFNKFPLDELSKLSDEIMKYSGIGGEKAGK
jgi:hypothetical protein